MHYQEDFINIAYCCSDLFSEVCAVSIVSLFENNKHLNEINVYILEDRISEKNKKRFQDIACQYGRKITLVSMPMPNHFYHDERYTFDTVGRTFGRMIWGDVLPETIHKIISLDSDTMILGDINELWNYDLQGKPIAGVDDCMGKVAMVKTQHLEADTVHCNAGMYVIDLDVWREENWTEIFHQYINKLFDKGIALGGYEEEVITHTLSERFFLLPPKFNLMTLEQVFTYKEALAFRQPLTYYCKDEIKEALAHPVITHTTNFFYIKKRIFEAKSDHPQRTNYEKYRAITPWRDDPPMDAKYSLKHDLIKGFWHAMPRPITIRIARFVRNEIRPRLDKKRDDI